MTGLELARIPGTPPGLSVTVLREQLGAGDASDGELVHFAAVCNRLDLSPWAEQIVLIGRWNRKANRNLYRHQITVAGRRALASRTGRPYRVDGPVWCGPRERGELVWRDVWDEDGEDHYPYCARVLIYFTEFAEPAANGTAKWSEFAQYDSNANLLPTWRSMPSHMLGKVAESMALRRAFPDVIDPAVAEDLTFPIEPVDDANAADVAGEIIEATATRPTDWKPTLNDQGDAHRIIGALDDDSQERFLADWRIDNFSGEWSPEAVADALSRRPT